MMFNWLKKKITYEDVMEHVGPSIESHSVRVSKLETELHGWQSAMYSLMNALRLDLIKDENGQVIVQQRKKK